MPPTGEQQHPVWRRVALLACVLIYWWRGRVPFYWYLSTLLLLGGVGGGMGHHHHSSYWGAAASGVEESGSVGVPSDILVERNGDGDEEEEDSRYRYLLFRFIQFLVTNFYITVSSFFLVSI
jgi:hypothetical protein